LIDFLSFQS